MEIYVFTRLRQWWSVTILENLGSDQTIYDSDGWRVAKTNWTERGPDRSQYLQIWLSLYLIT